MLLQAADVTSACMDETLKAILTRLSDVENGNRALKQQNINVTQEIAVLKRDNHQLKELGEGLTKKVDALEQENSRLNDEFLNRKDACSLNFPNTTLNVTSSESEPGTRS